MFYNGFTLLMQMLAGATMYWVGHYYGYSRGEAEMYTRCQRAQQTADEFFSDISRKGQVQNQGRGLLPPPFFLSRPRLDA